MFSLQFMGVPAHASVSSPPRDKISSFGYAGFEKRIRNEHPMERAPLLLLFGDPAERVAVLIHAQPLLIPRLIVAPREAVHAIAAYLYLAPDAAQPDAEVATIIYETDPRHLLR